MIKHFFFSFFVKFHAFIVHELCIYFKWYNLRVTELCPNEKYLLDLPETCYMLITRRIMLSVSLSSPILSPLKSIHFYVQWEWVDWSVIFIFISVFGSLDNTQ